MTNKDQDPGNVEVKAYHTLRSAFDRVTRWFGNLLAPLVIVTYAKDVQDAIDFIVARPVLTGTFALVFVAVLAYNVFRNLDIQFRVLKWRREHSLLDETESELRAVPETLGESASVDTPSRRQTLWRWVAVIGSGVALVIVVYMYVTVFVTGLYYVVVASAPNKESAIHEIQALNAYFEEAGYSDLEARAHVSTASESPWYMISIGGWHTSRKAAEITFRKAKQVMGPRMRSDAYIYSTKNISPIRVIIGWLRRQLAWMRGIFQ